MKKNILIIVVGIVALLVGGGVGFFGGMKYQQSKTPQNGQFFGQRNVQGMGGNRRFLNGNNSSAVRGQVLSRDNNSVTVKLQDGSTKIVILGSSTMIAKSTLGTADDIANGNNITVFGTMNSDGTITAQDVQVGNLGFFGPRASASPSPSTTY